MNGAFSLTGQIIDVVAGEIFPGQVRIKDGKIEEIVRLSSAPAHFISPGFIDAHIHIESSMLTPAQFARAAVVHGTVSTISDPHEIANVMGVQGVEYMIADAKQAPLKIRFGAPSCVPATDFETAGATIHAEAVAELLGSPDIHYLSEMMNYPGVLHSDPGILAKINAAKKIGKPVDGHAPGLRGEDAKKYANAGISTDHECTTLEEGAEKRALGMKILIREGSAARNYDALIPLLDDGPDGLMFCSDDKHPDELLEGHINLLAGKAIAAGYPPIDVFRVACLNPKLHYKIDVGMLQPNDPADLIVFDDLYNPRPKQVYINGVLVAENGECLVPEANSAIINHFNCEPISANQLIFPAKDGMLKVICAHDGLLTTTIELHKPKIDNGNVVSDPERDLLKIAVVNRYSHAPVALGWIKNVGLKSGAIASSVAHDSHNIIAIGADDASIVSAVNAIISEKGGVAFGLKNEFDILPLPVAGLMSTQSAEFVGAKYSVLDALAKRNGSTLRAPYMTLSFMALLVIPQLKLSDKGLFDAESFSLVDAWA